MSIVAALRSLTSDVQRGIAAANSKTVALMVVSVVCVIAPLEVDQLVFALIGALAYGGLQALQPRPKTQCQLAAERELRERTLRSPGSSSASAGRSDKNGAAGRKGSGDRSRPGIAANASQKSAPAPFVPRKETYQPSLVPILPPKFQSKGLEAEVDELLVQLATNSAEQRAVSKLALHIECVVRELLPEAEVSGFAQGSLKCGRAFGVAVPEVDVVASVNPMALQRRLQQRAAGANGLSADPRKLQKSAVRACTDRLVSAGGLKFRRSAFRGNEPRVTLLVPVSLGFFSEAIPIDFSVNSVTPFYSAALLTECGQIESRAKALILLVRRWAKDRGICHAAKGHLSPYLWSILVMYFLQVREEAAGKGKDASLLPPLEAFAASSGLLTSVSPAQGWPQAHAGAPAPKGGAGSESATVAQLFSEFSKFYDECFDWSNEAISVRLGSRTVKKPAGSKELLAIEDPFEAGSMLGESMNSLSLARLREELARASDLCRRGSSLTELLQPWVPEDAPEKSSCSDSNSRSEEN